MTDDQPRGTMKAMPKTQALLGDSGAQFDRFHSTFPLCCPSRATYLTGQYAHNHGVQNNHPPEGGFEAFRDEQALPVWLDDAGYRTMHIGKYLNGYGRRDNPDDYIPPGWDRWIAPIGSGSAAMYDYELNENGGFESYGSSNSDYQTDVFARRARSFIHHQRDTDRPFYLSVAVHAPHVERGSRFPKPARRHTGDFSGEPLPRPPSFDEKDVGDKPGFVRALPRLDEGVETVIKKRWQRTLESLKAVDDLNKQLVTELRDSGKLANTLFIFTADNGFFFGEHRLAQGKSLIYDDVVNVPFILRGPCCGVAKDARPQQLSGNIDIAPTILDATGASAGVPQDGRSLIPLSRDPAAGEGRELLIETQSIDAIRTDRFVYAEPADERELYDMEVDPWQLESRHDDPSFASTEAELRDRLDELRDCSGASCR